MTTTRVGFGRKPAVSMRVGATTQRFFEEGEQHEAADWKDTILPPDDVPDSDPETQFESFDKIPKRRSPLVTVAAIAACLLIGVAAWTLAFSVLRTGKSVRDGAKAMTSGPSSSAEPRDRVPATNTTAANDVGQNAPRMPAAGPNETAPGAPLVVPVAPNSPTTPPTIAAPQGAGAAPASKRTPSSARSGVPGTSVIEISSVPQPAAAPNGGATTVDTVSDLPAGAGTDPALRERRLATSVGSGSGQQVAPGAVPGSAAPTGSTVRPPRSPSDESEAAVGDRKPGREGRDDRAPPLRGYVWSPSAKALVPADPSALPTTDPDFAERRAASLDPGASGR